MAKDETTEKTAAVKEEPRDQKLLTAACRAYGIPENCVFAHSVKPDGAVVIVTAGGSRVTWRAGMADIEPLGQIAVTGVNPEAKKRKVVAGAKK